MVELHSGFEERGNELISGALFELEDALQPCLRKVSECLTSQLSSPTFVPFVVLGSWAAKMLCDTLTSSGQLHSPVAASLVANDIDVHHGKSGDGPLELVPHKNKKHTVEGIGIEVNTVEVTGFDCKRLLANNDVNATAVAVDVFGVGGDGELDLTVHVHPAFWRFILMEQPTLEATDPDAAKARTLARLAFKAMQMKLPFNTGGIKADSETIFRSHKEKVEEIQKAESNFFASFKVVPVPRSTGEFILEEKQSKVQCSKCSLRSANKKCKGSCCAQCCHQHQANDASYKCKVHKQKKRVATQQNEAESPSKRQRSETEVEDESAEVVPTAV